MKLILLLLITCLAVDANAVYSMKWTWDVKPPSRVSAGSTFSIQGHWDVSYSTSTSTRSQRITAVWTITKGSGRKISGNSFRADSTLTLWGSGIAASSEVPDLNQYVTVMVNSSAEDGTISGGGASTSGGLDIAALTTNYPVAAVSVDVTNLVVRQRYPWNKFVDIDFNCVSRPMSWYDLTLMAINNVDGSVLPIKTVRNGNQVVTGDGLSVSDSRGRLVWVAGTDLPVDFVSSNVTVSVEAKARHPAYCVIDLSEGKNATEYAVTYLDDIPKGGWSDEYKSFKLVLRLIPSGTFVMCGVRPVTISKPYYMGVFEVTWSQWAMVFDYSKEDFAEYKEQIMKNPIPKGGVPLSGALSGTLDAQDFANKVREKSHLQGITIPTEAQWEFACRAGTVSKYNNGGSSVADLKKVGWYYGNATKKQNVGTLAPNAWGLYDMHGNVYEWCRDVFLSTGKWNKDPVIDPCVTVTQAVEAGASQPCNNYVIKGGSYSSDAEDCASSSHTGSIFGASTGDSGFRIVCEIE